MRLALLCLLVLQDDPSRWLDQLRSDDVRERDAATRRLDSLGAAAVERLLPLAGDDLEVRSRLRQILATLKKREEMAKVFGPTKRVTAAFKQRRLAEVLEALGKSLQETITGEGIDREKLIDLELNGATLWEALDALARAAGVSYDYGDRQVTLRPGRGSDLPWKAVEQFRIGIIEMKRMEHRAPGRSGEVGVVTVVASYQRNMKPVRGWFRDGIVFDSVVDAAGRNVKVERVDWSNSTGISHQPFSKLNMVLVRCDQGPFTIEGRTQIQFEVKTAEVTIPMAEGKREAVAGDTSFRIDDVVQTASGLSLELHMEGNGREPGEKLKTDSVALVDGNGKRHAGTSRSASFGGNHVQRTFVFTGVVEKPDRLVLGWITEFHLVEIPFRFEGVQVP
jgi:hypothetical protein